MTTHEKLLKRLGIKESSIHMGMFDFTIIVAIGKYDSLEEYVQHKNHEKKFNLAEANRGYAPRGMYFAKPGYCPILWLPRYPKTRIEQGTLAHEATHIVFKLFEWVGCPIDDSTEEVFAHAVAHIVRKTLESKSNQHT